MPESMIEQSTEYKILQTKYSLVVNDNIKLKQALDESKNLLDMSRGTFQRQLEHMESEELAQQKKLGNEMMQLEEQLAQVRKENELLRIEYEQNVAANEQTGPINKEMRSLITTLQTNNKLLKSDINRTKKRLDESIQECKRLKEQNAQLMNVKKEETVKQEPSMIAQCATSLATVIKTEMSNEKEATVKKEVKEEEIFSGSGSSQLKELKDQNRKLSESNKELRGQLELIKHKQSSPATPSTPSRSAELDDAKREIKRLKEQLVNYKSSNNKHTPSASSQSNNSNNVTSPHLNPHSSSSSSSNQHHHHHADEHNNSHVSNDSVKKIKSLEETIKELHKSLNSKRQEETALLNDMEITGQAFEDMQVD